MVLRRSYKALPSEAAGARRRRYYVCRKSISLPKLRFVADYTHSRGLRFKVEDAERGWYILGKVEELAHELSPKPDEYWFNGYVLHDYGDDADFPGEFGPHCLADLKAHVERQGMAKFEVNAWMLPTGGAVDAGGISVSAYLDVDPDEKPPDRSVYVNISGEDAGDVMSICDRVWRTVESARSSEIEPLVTFEAPKAVAYLAAEDKRRKKHGWWSWLLD